jgi:membrane protease YdiL (CAAX protease family)
MLRALSAIDDPSWKLDLVGGGSGVEAERCRALAERLGERVVVHGPLPQDRLAGVMRECHLLVLPSFYEGLPLIVLEGLASGCRIVATDLPGTRELLGDAGVDFVTLVETPRLHDVDRPYEEDEQAFERELRAAMQAQMESARETPRIDVSPIEERMTSYSWPGVFRRVLGIYSQVSPPSPRWRPMNPGLHAAVALTVFALALISHRILGAIPGYAETIRSWPEWAQGLLQPLRWVILILLGLIVARIHPREWLRDLGLAVHPWRALAFSLVCSVPLLVAGLTGNTRAWNPQGLLFAAGIWPLAEELLFRGYAFGQLCRRGRWNVWAAAVVTGVLFGAVHLLNKEVQVHEIPGQLLSVSIIAAGGIAYAWLFYRWRFNLWIAVGVHGFMNLWYAAFDMAETPIGSTGLIIARIAVVAAAITATEVLVRQRKRRDSP